LRTPTRSPSTTWSERAANEEQEAKDSAFKAQMEAERKRAAELRAKKKK